MRRSLIVAVLALLAYFILGSSVSSSSPSAFDRSAEGLIGVGEPLARIFTQSCLWYALTAFGIMAIITAIVLPTWRGRILFAVIVTLATWQTSDALKVLFGRPRPTHWIWVHESSAAYSSGHAVFAVLVYGLWAYFIWRSSLPTPVRTIVAVVLGVWACGVIWSRLALGAHYPTDLIGGVLLATTALGIGNAVAIALASQRVAARYG